MAKRTGRAGDGEGEGVGPTGEAVDPSGYIGPWDLAWRYDPDDLTDQVVYHENGTKYRNSPAYRKALAEQRGML